MQARPERRLFLKCILICLITLLFAPFYAQESDQSIRDFQSIRDHYARFYSADYNLLNGRKYYLLFSAVSHPFFGSDQFRRGTLLINGVRYEGVIINYDIYQQQVILQYISHSGQAEHLALADENIEKFILDGKIFSRMSFPETGSGFFQVVTSGGISCLLAWEKKLVYTPGSSTTLFNFTSQKRSTYLLMDGRVHPFRYRSSFTRIFDEPLRKDIRRYCRREQIYLNQASDTELGKLVRYCNSLSNNLNNDK